MNEGARRVRRTYLILTVLSTLSTSFIWGINTLFLLDAGLSNTAAFAANAFTSLGQMVFEVPTGVVADTRGRRVSFLWGAATLLASTLIYLLMWQTRAPLVGWAIASVLLGLGFTFFSGAVEAWLVDALRFHDAASSIESVFARGQSTTGAAMLAGSVTGGYLAQVTNLGVPYLVRSVVMGITFIVAWRSMRDEGFSPVRSAGTLGEVRRLLSASVEHGWRIRPLRWTMLSGTFTMGTAAFIFYASQPHLLDLYGDSGAFGIAGIAAAVVAGAQIVGGLIAPRVRRLFRRRTEGLVAFTVVSLLAVASVGLTANFYLAVSFIAVWGLMFSAGMPMRQGYVNDMIPSTERATVLSFDSLLGSAGAVAFQPPLGRSADLFGYPAAYLMASGVQVFAIPLLWLSRRAGHAADRIDRSGTS